MIDSSRKLYHKKTNSNPLISHNKHQAIRKNHKSQLTYTNLYEHSGPISVSKYSRILYNNQCRFEANQNHNFSRTSIHFSREKLGTDSTNKILETNYSTRRESKTSKNESTKIKSISKLNHAEPKSFMDTLRRQTPFQKSQSSSRISISNIMSSKKVIQKSIQKKDRENDRNQGNTFISIPKVKSILNQKPKRTKPKKYKKNNLQTKLRKMGGYTPKVRVNPILLNKNIRTSKNIINTNIKNQRKQIYKNRSKHVYNLEHREYPCIYSDTKTKIADSNLFQNRNTLLQKDNQLKQDIFKKETDDDSTFIDTPSKSKIYRRASRLQTYMDNKNRSISEIDHIEKLRPSTNLLNEMSIKKPKLCDNRHSLYSSRSVPKMLVSKKAFDIKVECIETKVISTSKTSFYHEKYQKLDSQKMSEELNHFLLTSNQNEIKDIIIGQNRQCKQLQKDYKQLDKTSRKTLQKKLLTKQKIFMEKKKQLSILLKDLKSSGIEEDPLVNQKENLSFEKSLSPEMLKKRKKLFRKLQKLDKRCWGLNLQLEEYSKGLLWMEEYTKTNQMFLLIEEKNLKDLLRNDTQDQVLKSEIKKMIKTLELVN